MARGTTAPSIIPYEFHRDVDATCRHPPEGAEVAAATIIEYNNANPVEGLKFGQDGLLASEAVDYTNPATTATYKENLTKGQTEDQAVIDSILKGRYGAIMVPQRQPAGRDRRPRRLPGADGAGGFAAENSSTGGDPVGVDFIGGAYSEASCWTTATRFEQGRWCARPARRTCSRRSNANSTFSGAPSETNQSMWRCVPGSAFFSRTTATQAKWEG